jgi:hypothetical protein
MALINQLQKFKNSLEQDIVQEQICPFLLIQDLLSG